MAIFRRTEIRRDQRKIASLRCSNLKASTGAIKVVGIASPFGLQPSTTVHIRKAMAPARVPRLLIVGGVAGGMSAATRARRLCEDTEIIVFESGQYVSYANCGIPYALGGVIKDDRSLVLQTPQSFKERYNIDVHLGSEVIAIDRERKEISVRHAHDGSVSSYYYDHLILAQGAEAMRLPIPGKDLPPVFTLQTIDDLEHITNFIHVNECERAVVIGGGFIGLEAAENIHKLGLGVTIVEYLPHVMPIADAEIAEPLHDELRKHGLRLLLNAKVERIRAVNTKRAKSVSSLMVDTSQGDSISADIVLMCVGLRARTSLAATAGLELGNTGVFVNEFMQTSDPAIYAVGDMAETQNIISFDWSTLMLAGPANRQGRCAANHIMKKEHRYRGNVGTSICKVFDLTIATTGLSVHALRRLKRPVEWVTVHPPDHATYYPDATPITLKVAFDPDDGHLLGAQAVGQKGVDKRIDVISTALLANMVSGQSSNSTTLAR